MDTALQALLSWQFILFCLALTSVTYVVRLVVDYILNSYKIDAKSCHLWVELILPILPLTLGCLGALLAKKYPYPVEIISASGRVAFGLCAGLLSGLVWRVVKSTIGAKLVAFAPATPVTPVIAPDVGEGAAAQKAQDTENKG